MEATMNRKIPLAFWMAMAIVLSACSSENPVAKAEMQRQSEELKQQEAALQKTVHEGSVPSNYKTQIDRALARTLIDPDSRKVEFTVNPYGGLVCGRVNAKNSFGGYTGYNQFIAIYDSSKTLTRLQIVGGAEPTGDTDSFYVLMIGFDCLKGHA
jgi:hypothetical protein